MAIFKRIGQGDVNTTTTALSQLIDVIQEDISGSSSRKAYAMFVTASSDGVRSYAVTSSLFQTVHDQDYTLQSANAIFDLSMGLWYSGTTVQTAKTGEDSNGKLLFSVNSMQMREKVDMYKLFAGKLLGNSDSAFYAPYDSSTSTDRIDEALFLSFKRLFARDKIKPETFAMRFYTTACFDNYENSSFPNKYNLNLTSTSGSTVFTDVGAASNRQVTFGGEVGTIVNSSNSSQKVGIMFYDSGIAVLDMKKIISGTQHVSGVISAVTGTASPFPISLNNQTIIGHPSSVMSNSNRNAKFIPDLMVSGSIDDVLNHFASARFSSGSYTAMTFQNITNINSTLIFCRASADEFNYSSNPTFTDSSNNITVIDDQTVDRSFTFPTTVGLYTADNTLVAVAKFSRPIEKNDEKDLTVRVRLDF
jgi:hypothetical protein